MEAIDLLNLAQTDVTRPLPPSVLLAALQQPPFVSLPGSFNTRDLGLLPGSPIRPGLVYRSGGFLAPNLPAEAPAAIVGKLGIKRIFDLRSAKEHERQPDPAIAGAETVWTRPGEEDGVIKVEDFVEEGGAKGYAEMYMDLLRVYAGAFKAVLEYVRDCEAQGESGGFMFHCTAGRDRTGIMAGLLLSLAGASPETVALDYILSRIGTEPAREQLITLVLKGTGAESTEAPGFHNLCNLKISYWEAFVKVVEQEHGGFEGYVKRTLGFSDADLAKIKRNLVLEN
ncbi:Tyrosine specific protein phosphatases domain-containing protein [Madurella fahalii]|uniref:Tyrosine specific protein phosphatases domain-containing protein n=1 Tax=Madurella fahalii TaxID=1157608 RepID=A0ABQ0G898_9PEZI